MVEVLCNWLSKTLVSARKEGGGLCPWSWLWQRLCLWVVVENM